MSIAVDQSDLIQLAKVSPSAWCRLIFGEWWQPYPHVQRIHGALVNAVTSQDPADRRLIIQLPPQHGKSTSVSIGFASWFLGRNPEKNVAICSYAADLAKRFSNDARNMFKEHSRHVFGVKVDETQDTKDYWKIAGFRGGFKAVGVGGGLSGFPADLLIVDDPYKDHKTANSPTYRKDVWDWYTSVAVQRMSKTGVIVVIHTRWTPDDLIGRLLMEAESGGEQWVNIRLPAIAEEDEYDSDGNLLRQKGEPLCADAHPLEQLEAVREQIGPYKWSCLYQQNPIQPEGRQWGPELFGPDVIIGQMPDAVKIKHLVIAVDSSLGDAKEDGDYTAAVALAMAEDGLLYVDCMMDVMAPSVAFNAIANWIRSLPRIPDGVGIDEHGYQALYSHGLAETLQRNGIMSPVMEVPHENAKKTLRIVRLDPFLWNKDFRFVRSRGTSLLIEQLKEFPCKSCHDDGPDALEMATRLLVSVARA